MLEGQPCCTDDESRLQLNLVVDRWTDFTSEIYVLDVCGRPLDYTGVSAVLMVRRHPRDTNPLITIATTPTTSGAIYFFPAGNQGNGVVNRPGGVYFVTTKLVNQTLALPEVVFDMAVTWATGFSSVLLGGRMRIREGVTR